MKGCQKFQFGVHLVPKCLPEVADKLNVPIRHHSFVQPMQLDDIIKEKDIDSECINGLRAQDEVGHFGKN